MYSAAFGWNVLYKCIKSIHSDVSFKDTLFLLTFCLDDIFIDVGEVLKFSINNCFLYFGTPMFGAYILITVMPS